MLEAERFPERVRSDLTGYYINSRARQGFSITARPLSEILIVLVPEELVKVIGLTSITAAFESTGLPTESNMNVLGKGPFMVTGCSTMLITIGISNAPSPFPSILTQ